jgi:uncharacterized membrane protein YeaQ/YmgE (transglycosylase-associated protein family)
MIVVLLVAALAVGLVAGAGADALLRGRDPRSAAVVIAGVVGAIAGLFMRRAFSAEGEILIPLLVAFFGGMLAAFVVRVRISAA